MKNLNIIGKGFTRPLLLRLTFRFVVGVDA
jgi:hypothetical protein